MVKGSGRRRRMNETVTGRRPEAPKNEPAGEVRAGLAKALWGFGRRDGRHG